MSNPICMSGGDHEADEKTLALVLVGKGVSVSTRCKHCGALGLTLPLAVFWPEERDNNVRWIFT